jgi:hypothetical protein
MAGQPDLFIPRKTAPQAHQGYREDMQTIEEWAKRLTAGGGGGASIGYVGLTMISGDPGDLPSYWPETEPGLFPGALVYPLAGGTSVTAHTSLQFFGAPPNGFWLSIGGGWHIVPSSSGLPIWVFPQIFTPPYTAPVANEMQFQFFVRAYALDGIAPSSNNFQASTGAITVPSNTLHVTHLADWTINIAGPDLFQFANGVYQSLGTLQYLVSWTCFIVWWPTVTSFP